MYSQGTDSAVEGNENIQKVVLRANVIKLRLLLQFLLDRGFLFFNKVIV